MIERYLGLLHEGHDVFSAEVVHRENLIDIAVQASYRSGMDHPVDTLKQLSMNVAGQAQERAANIPHEHFHLGVADAAFARQAD